MALPTSLPTHGYMPCHEQHASGALRVCPSSAITPLPADLGHPSSQETKHECLVSHRRVVGELCGHYNWTQRHLARSSSIPGTQSTFYKWGEEKHSMLHAAVRGMVGRGPQRAFYSSVSRAPLPRSQNRVRQEYVTERPLRNMRCLGSESHPVTAPVTT